jgi:hypothetical protein
MQAVKGVDNWPADLLHRQCHLPNTNQQIEIKGNSFVDSEIGIVYKTL